MIVDFYTEEGTDSYGHTFQDMIAMNNGQLESSHDVIQWLFPLHEPSNFNPDAPLVDEETAQILKSNPTSQARIKDAVIRYAIFLGFDENFSPTLDFESKSKHWRRQNNHNHLRITRVIRSLRLFGFEELAQQFFQAVLKAGHDKGCLSENTVFYWSKALNDEVFNSLR